MQHLTEEQLVALYYHDDDHAAAANEHLARCGACREQYDTICGVLSLVTATPVPERSAGYGEEVWTRLRWKLGARQRRIRWQSGLAAAAVLALVFIAGQWWNARRQPAGGQPVRVQQQAGSASSSASTSPSAVAAAHIAANDRVLVVVVGDHLESSERMLAQLANADPRQGYEIGDQHERATELVASNRLYRQAASQGGDQQIASLLSDLEPILVELSHAGATLEPEQLAAIQKRIESKGLLFKVRVMSARSSGGEQVPHGSGSV
jgi:hypothetical protein